jgi:hypothetical protein
MQVIDKQSVADILAMESLAELHKARETIQLFEQKHGKIFARFEEDIGKGDEQFDEYDDYIDWKAAVKWQDELERRISELKHGYFKVA